MKKTTYKIPNTRSKKSSGPGGVGLGSVIAALVSWTQWHSILWAFLHGICGWIYLIFWGLGLTESKPF